MRIRAAAIRADVLAAILATWPLLAATTVARAAEAPAAMFVIDGSGSMWGRLEPDKRAKIDVIRDLVKAKISESGSSRIGLTSFGHRRKGDCSDVEVIAAATDVRDPVLAPLEKLNPRGKGPIATALREAAASLGPSRPASLIVIGDGVDNCQQDPCAAADEIAKSAPGVAIHMIAIGVDAAEHPRLACVAKATGGSFADVKDTVGLASAIDAVVKLALLAPDAPRAVTAATMPTAVPLGASLHASAALAEGGTLLTQALSWKIFKLDGTDAVVSGQGSDIAATLDPGTYDVAAQLGAITARKSITVERGRPLNVVVPLNAARLRVRAGSVAANDVSASAIVTITHDGETAEQRPPIVSRAGMFDGVIAPGAYIVTVADGGVRQTKPVALDIGADTTLDLVLGTGRLDVTAALREDGGAIEDVTFTVSEDDPDSPNGRREVARSRAANADFTLPAGTYYVTARSGPNEIRQRMAVGVGDTVKRVLVMPMIPLKVTTQIAGKNTSADQGIVTRITALDGDLREVSRSLAAETEVHLTPGRYRASVQLPGQRMLASQDVNLEAGKPAELVLKVEAAEVALRPAAGLSTVKGDTFWEIVDAKGQPVWRTTVVEPKALLAPGRYTVRLESREKRSEAAFEVRSGERREIEVGAR